MVAYIEVIRNAGEPARILKVDNARDNGHAEELLTALTSRHVSHAKLLTLESYSAAYTAHEIETEQHLLGRRRDNA